MTHPEIETVPGIATHPYLGVLKGNHGFNFEFKLAKGAVKFIRYQDGEREFSTSNYVFYCFTEPEKIPMILRLGFKSYTGMNERILKRVIQFVQSNPTSF